jgi:hypothetical protein
MRLARWFVVGIGTLLMVSHAFPQSPREKSYLDEAIISQTGDRVHIFANSPLPLLQVLDALDKKYWWKVSYEDPHYTSDLDLVENVDPEYLKAHPGARAVAPAGGAFSVDFPSGPAPNKPPEEYSTLQIVIDAYNRSGNPGRFELRSDGKGNFDVVGVAAYDRSGHLVQQKPVLDATISVTPQERTGRDGVELIRQALSQQIGTPVGDATWGGQFMKEVMVKVEGRQEPVRTVLWRTLSTISSSDGGLKWVFLYDYQSAIYVLNVE